MVRRKHQRRPEIEALESLELLSGILTVGHQEATAMIARGLRPSAVTVLSGTAKGKYHVTGGRTMSMFSGTGNVSPLGAAKVDGMLNLAGFNTTGQLTLTSKKLGEIFLTVKPMGLGPDYTYQITGGTKSFAGATGSGVTTTTITPSGDATATHGHFVLVFLG